MFSTLRKKKRHHCLTSLACSFQAKLSEEKPTRRHSMPAPHICEATRQNLHFKGDPNSQHLLPLTIHMLVVQISYRKGICFWRPQPAHLSVFKPKKRL